MKRFLAALLLCAMALAGLAAVGGATTDGPEEEDAAMAGFDQDFLDYIHAQNEGENYIVSPLSFRAALMLAVEGADAATRAQLLGAMGFASEEEMAQWYSAVRESVESFDEW